MSELKYLINFYVPADHCDQVKAAMFAEGAGKIGNYDCCSFEYNGAGQFRPLDGAKPFIGNANNLEKITEVKVEMVCLAKYAERVIMPMKKAHPYEEVAYHVLRLEDF